MADSRSTDELISRAAEGDSAALTALVNRYRERLRRMVALRLDRRLQGRVDASDIVQEALIEATRRLGDYARNRPMEYFLWLRAISADKLFNVHRKHLGTQKRNASREFSLYRRPMPEACTDSLARQLLGQITTPSRAVARAELQSIVQDVLNSMDPVDREILVLRNFEQLTTSEAAKELSIKRSTAGKRYIAALKRLKHALSACPGIDQQDL